MAANILRNPLPSHVFFTLISNLLIISMLHTALATTSSTQDYEKYIQNACNSTQYQELCYKSLSPYASTIKENPQLLCKAALSISLQSALDTSSTISKLLKQKGHTSMEAQVIEVCDSNIKASIDQLHESLDAMKLLSGPDKAIQLGNIKTWVSAAITGDTTCTDTIDEEGQEIGANIKNEIGNSVSNMDRMTNIALSLVSHRL
ncbi:21 kDa protein [Morella rubra]|uniref:21 kDa protein n=1 Tax=Morella rubra TaxID=262757 RepID=A0A6A1VDQ7_9ROSI|nr:21 kDa protein [Morella rubra]